MIRVAVVGHKLAAELIADYLMRRSDTELTAVITRASSWEGNLKAWSEANSIPCYVGNPNHYVDELMLRRPDLLLCLQYREKFGKRLRAVPKAMNPINMHYSLLPQYKGPNTIRRVLASGDEMTGVTWHLMTQEYDSGDILYQEWCKVFTGDTFASLHDRVTALASGVFPTFFDALVKGKINPIPQSAVAA